MTVLTPDPEVPTHSAAVAGALGKLEATRRDLRRSSIWVGLATLLLAELLLGAVFVLADWMWVLPAAVRALGLPAMVALAVILHFRARRQYTRDQAAADVEAHFPELGQRLRTVVEYAEPTRHPVAASPGLLKALGRDTDRRTARLDFGKLVPWRTFERRAVVSFVAVLFGLVALFMNSELRTAALRMVLLPFHYTTLQVQPGDLTLKAGEELKLDVTLSGRPVKAAHWYYRDTNSGSEWTAASLAPGRDAKQPAKPLYGTLTTSRKDCQADFDYRVVAGELESPVFHVKVVHPLVVRAMEAAVTPPAYTRKPPEVVKGGNFKAIEGSQVELTITLDHAPTSAQLVLGAPGEAPVQVPLLNIGDAKLAGRLPVIAKDVQYRIDAVDADGMTLEADSFRIKVVPDQKPTLAFRRPEDSLAVTPTTEVPIEVEASDDFGVSQVGITYKVGNGPEETLHLADIKDQPVTAQALATLYLEKHQIAYPDEISYYAFVLDNYPPQAHRVVSEMRFIDILPYKQEYQFMDGEGGEPSAGSLSLEELIARQRVNLSRTFVLEGDRSIDKAAAMKLATFEEELASATTEFSDGLKARGINIPALDEAASAMRSATDALDRKDLPPARTHEEAALKSLISVRQNLRKLLGLNPGQQASACRAFDRQQVQKIRRPPQDKKELLEAELMELAKREEEFSEEIEAKGGGGPDVEPPPANQQQPAEDPEDSSQDPSSKKSSSSSSATKSGSASTKNSTNSTQSRMNPVEQQQKAAAEAERLRQMAQKDKNLTELAKERLDAAAKIVQESSRAMEEGKSAEAAEKARDAARKLQSAARQVGALKAKELADALARERDIAQAIAKAERELGKSLDRGTESKPGDTGTESKPGDSEGRSGPGKSKRGESGGRGGLASSKQAGTVGRRDPASRQRELADEVAALGDVLEKLRSEAALDYRELAQAIDRAARRNPPDEVEGSMRRTAQAIESGRTAQAARDADQAAQRLEDLAQDLEIARRSAVQPQLERLLAAEKQAAKLQERLRSMRQPSHLAEVQKGMADLADVVDKLAPGQGSMRQAADSVQSAIRGAHTGVLNRVDRVVDDGTGYFVPPVGYNEGVALVILALQAKIQEIILENALVERTGPVPPQYKELVEDYYRVLSQDLR